MPGHWRSSPTLAKSDGPILFRRRFELPAPEAGRRRWITFDGIFYQADVWLDGAYLGDPEGYFFPHSFDVTALSRLGDDHVLAVEVTCNPEPGTTGRRNITGLFQHSEAVARDWNPGGIWRPVLVYDTGPGQARPAARCCAATPTTPAPTSGCTPASTATSPARCACARRPTASVVGETEHPLAAGVNEIDWSLDVDRPRLWWPRALGEQPLTEIDVEVLVDGERSDRRSRRTGLREVAWNDWVCSINGERLFLKGANLLPTRPGLADAITRRGPARRRAGRRGRSRRAARPGPHRRPRAVPGGRRARDAAAAGLPAAVGLRPPDPQGGRAPGPRGRRLARPPPVDRAVVRPRRADRRGAAGRDRPAGASGSGASSPSSCRRGTSRCSTAGSSARSSRPTRRARRSPTAASCRTCPQLDGTDSHLWLGWHRGDVAELAELARLVPRLVRFVSEFGAQSVPDRGRASSSTRSRWPELDWEALREHHGLEVEVMLQRVPPDEHPTFDAWRTATQRNQATILRHHIETLRRLKYRPDRRVLLLVARRPGADDLGVGARRPSGPRSSPGRPSSTPAARSS